MIGRNGSVSSLLTIGTADVTAATPSKGNLARHMASIRGSA